MRLLPAHLHRDFQTLVAAHHDHLDGAVRQRALNASFEFFRSPDGHLQIAIVKFDHNVAIFDACNISRQALVKLAETHAKHLRARHCYLFSVTGLIAEPSEAFRATTKGISKPIELSL